MRRDMPRVMLGDWNSFKLRETPKTIQKKTAYMQVVHNRLITSPNPARPPDKITYFLVHRKHVFILIQDGDISPAAK